VSTLALIPLISAKVSYRPLEDFTHVAYAAGAPVALAVTPGAAVTTLAEFVAHAGRSERPLTFASSGVGSDGHLIGEAIGAAMKVRIEHVPYRNTSQALMDVVAGHVVFSTFTLSSTAQFLRQGTLKGIAVTAPERMPDYPDLPTFRELGHPELVSSTWFSLSGPAGLPAEIVATLNRAVNEAMVRPEVQARLRRDGLLAQPMGAADFTRFVAAEGARWRPLIERAGLVGKGE
jgi:tripartite-type tricarboxylate transporter receptor subunit TctC